MPSKTHTAPSSPSFSAAVTAEVSITARVSSTCIARPTPDKRLDAGRCSAAYRRQERHFVAVHKPGVSSNVSLVHCYRDPRPQRSKLRSADFALTGDRGHIGPRSQLQLEFGSQHIPQYPKTKYTHTHRSRISP